MKVPSLWRSRERLRPQTQPYRADLVTTTQTIGMFGLMLARSSLLHTQILTCSSGTPWRQLKLFHSTLTAGAVQLTDQKRAMEMLLLDLGVTAKTNFIKLKGLFDDMDTDGSGDISGDELTRAPRLKNPSTIPLQEVFVPRSDGLLAGRHMAHTMWHTHQLAHASRVWGIPIE